MQGALQQPMVHSLVTSQPAQSRRGEHPQGELPHGTQPPPQGIYPPTHGIPHGVPSQYVLSNPVRELPQGTHTTLQGVPPHGSPPQGVPNGVPPHQVQHDNALAHSAMDSSQPSTMDHAHFVKAKSADLQAFVHPVNPVRSAVKDIKENPTPTQRLVPIPVGDEATTRQWKGSDSRVVDDLVRKLNVHAMWNGELTDWPKFLSDWEFYWSVIQKGKPVEMKHLYLLDSLPPQYRTFILGMVKEEQWAYDHIIAYFSERAASIVPPFERLNRWRSYKLQGTSLMEFELWVHGWQ